MIWVYGFVAFWVVILAYRISLAVQPFAQTIIFSVIWCVLLLGQLACIPKLYFGISGIKLGRVFLEFRGVDIPLDKVISLSVVSFNSLTHFPW